MRGLPYLWTARVTLTDPGDAVALGVQTSDARYYVPGRAGGASVYRPESVPDSERFSPARWVDDLRRRGKEASCYGQKEDLARALGETCRSGDLVLFMFSASLADLIGQVQERLLANLDR